MASVAPDAPSNGFGSSDQTLLQSPLVVFVLGMKPRLIQDALGPYPRVLDTLNPRMFLGEAR